MDANAHVLDQGLGVTRMTVVAHGDPDENTSFHVPPATLASAGGVHGQDPCLFGALAHTITVDKVHSPFPVGVVFSAGDESLGGVPTHHVVSEHETGGYHVVGGKGQSDFTHMPVTIDIAHKGNLHDTVTQLVKRGTRWRNDVGKNMQDIIGGLEAVDGLDAKGRAVSRVLVPVDGDHPCSRALMLNADTKNGPFSQYSKVNRKLVKTGGRDHIIVEKSHLEAMAKTLEENLSANTPFGKHGLKMLFKPLPGVNGKKHKAGKIVMNINIHKHRAADIIKAGAGFAHEPDQRPLTASAATAVLDGVPQAAVDPATAESTLKAAVLGAKLAEPPKGAMEALALPAPASAPAPVPALPPAAHGSDDAEH